MNMSAIDNCFFFVAVRIIINTLAQQYSKMATLQLSSELTSVPEFMRQQIQHMPQTSGSRGVLTMETDPEQQHNAVHEATVTSSSSHLCGERNNLCFLFSSVKLCLHK